MLKTQSMNQTNHSSTHIPIFLLLLCSWATLNAREFVSELRGQGYSLIPAPQETSLTGSDIRVDQSWKVISEAGTGNIAAESLYAGALSLLNIQFAGTGDGEIILKIQPGILSRNMDKGLSRQGYRLSVSPGKVLITGSGETGLLYGVQSLLQLLRPSNQGGFTLPEGVITDWPDLPLRMIHWDTKHHQDRMETLKRFLNEAAYFKINAVAFEIEDKYEYPSHPFIGAPGAFTKAEMQELSAYALERYIQIIPMVQAPSHMAYVLKHSAFAHLRADGMNYQACVCDEEAIQLIFDMYQDMIDATPGMDYFLVSTDELYYAGICDKCPEPYNDNFRSQVWVDFVNRAKNWLSSRGRQMMAWIEYPLLMEDIPKLPAGLIGHISDGESREWIENLNNAKIRQYAYSSIQGSELLFPNYFRGKYRGRDIKGRLSDAANTVTNTLQHKADLIGTFAAAWDDAGLHNETFWLGWATVTQYAWSVGIPELEQSTADFMDVFYGFGGSDIICDYRLLQEGARYYENLWDRVISRERGPGYGNSHGKGIGVDRFDLTLSLPPLPSPGDSVMEPVFNSRYADKIEKAAALLSENDRLISHLQQSLTRASRNKYNLEVLLSIAYFERYTFNTILHLSKIENLLVTAAAARSNFSDVVNQMVEAHKLAGEILKEEAEMWAKFTMVWEKSRFKKCRSIGEEKFVHVLDDVKDHFADRRLGLEYMLAPFERMGLQKWQKKLERAIVDYAEAKNVAIVGLETERLED
jgi:hypothetical protein